jgi:hypothetical protein
MNRNETSPPKLKAHVDRKRLYMMLAIAICGYVLMAWFFLDRFERYILGAGVAIAVGFGVKEMLLNKARIVIDERGVLDSRLGLGWIRWRDITHVYIAQYQNVDHVCMDVVDPSRYLNKRSIAVRGMLKFHQKANNISPFSINVGVLDVGAEELYETIIAGMNSYGAGRSEAPSSTELTSHHPSVA